MCSTCRRGSHHGIAEQEATGARGEQVACLCDAEEQITGELAVLIDVFMTLLGFLRARAGRCLDEPDVWILLTEWEGVGTYRRALSSHAVKTNGYPVFVRIVDEPGAYEVLLGSA